MDAWMSWAGHHWKLDKMNFTHASVEGVARAYQDEAKRISVKINKRLADDKPVKDLQTKRKLLNQRVSALRSNRRRNNCLLFAHTSENPIAIDGSEVDQSPWLLPCANGVINLKTGELEDGRQEDYLLKASPIKFPDQGIAAAYPGEILSGGIPGGSPGSDNSRDDEADKIGISSGGSGGVELVESGRGDPGNNDAAAGGVELWEDTLLEIFSENQNLVDFLRRVCGYALVGEVSESILVVMTGRGRNGKSMIVETISKVMGLLTGPIRSEMLLDQFRVASSAGPTPDIMALRGLRMAFASETDAGCRISPSRVKWLTGNDTITGRNPHDKYEVHFKPSHTLFLLTNHKPHAPADDFAFWERMVLFPFELSFVDRKPKGDNEFRSDPQLGKKLEAILPEILAWMVRGCIEWQKDGRLIRPTVIKEAVNEYQRDEDSVGDFIEQCCVVGSDFKVKSADAYSVFEEWWQENVSKRVPLKKRFGQWFGKRFDRVKKGTIWYNGVGLLNDEEEESNPHF